VQLHSGAHVDERGGNLARRANYGFEKRQREIRKQKKKEEKAAQKREAADAPEHVDETLDGSPGGAGRTDSD
jgi:hypothetical protein